MTKIKDGETYAIKTHPTLGLRASAMQLSGNQVVLIVFGAGVTTLSNKVLKLTDEYSSSTTKYCEIVSAPLTAAQARQPGRKKAKG